MGKECADCGSERVMVCPNCDTRTTVDMDASRVDQPAASGGEKSHMQVIDELRARISELETENKRLGEERDGAMAVLRKIADTENPEHYGNARDALHAVKLRAEAASAANDARQQPASEGSEG